jgi:cephalosporin hydroxylase
VYQELIAETRPTLVLETGTFRGGSALYFADLLDVVADGGEVVTVDVTEEPERPDDPRITYISGSSVSPEVMTEMQTAAGRHERVMVVLDSDHSKEHVLAEMRVYADLVTPGCYLIVEDGLVNGHPVERRWGPGPYEAIQQFLAQDNRFEVDRAREKHYLTQNPSGYLRRRT